MDILLNGMVMSELTNLVHVSRVEYFGRRLVEKLKNTIPRQLVHVSKLAVYNFFFVL